MSRSYNLEGRPSSARVCTRHATSDLLIPQSGRIDVSISSLEMSSHAPAKDIYDVIRREQDALAAETRIANCPPYVAVNNLDDVLRTPTMLRVKHPALCRELSGSKGVAYIVDCPSLDSTALWVGTDNDKYRDDYRTFLNAVYRLNLTGIPKPYDVDHLYNRARGQNYKLQFLRVALVSHSVNRSHGAGPEKDVTTNEALRDSRGRPKLMDEIASMKYWGFLPPLRDDPRDSEISAYATFAAAKLGLDPKQVRESVVYLRDKASTPWAAKP